ncbi:MalM family protein [Vibrio europaeus]|uniref:MalM family protein n=1 Tax=Vibrio europaeus TaxID=300876 RepID=UPI00148B78AB|nr:MalM family protein [Vibrio europaeus]MDC5805813.1 MalM family protein [Vibrio europaeus]MDC5818577.1 MalM family protein [Vibrio europaeus]MDC5826114.1 MalM family protein [Vibrio europaeus]MDC5831478.1 MalM family protein [Vibrio europaeus]MDC5834433.1 MalM family protein [Vibrio europaeus]
MNKFYPLLFSALLFGCTSTDTVSTVAPADSIQITRIADVDWQKLEVPASVEFKVSEQSQSLLNENSIGPIAAFEVPGNRGSLDIELSTLVQNEKSLYAANIMILDANDNVLYQRSFNEFNYKHAKYLDPDMFETKLTVVPDSSLQPLRVLIYTTLSDVQNTSTVLHPAKLFAMAKSTVPPQVEDPTVFHASNGLLRLNVSANDIVTKRIREHSEYVPSSVDSSDFYIEQIEKAVKNGEIPKALSLLDEAKALNIDGAQEAFVKAVNAK